MAAADGTRFLVLWTDGDASAGLGRLYDGTGSALGSPFQVHKGGLFQRITGAARGTSDGEFLVALTEHGIPEDEDDVFVRRLRPGRILGNRCVLRATAGGTRKVVCSAKERLSPSFVVGDPVGGGATLRVVTTGGTPADQTFALPAVRWSAVGAGPQGYRYADPAGADGPVRSVRVQRRSSQTFTLTATITGTSPGVQLVPPNPGESVVMALQLAGGETYCAGFGLGQGGGTIGPNDATAFQVRRPITAGSCPP
jgi:hypothetical protein